MTLDDGESMTSLDIVSTGEGVTVTLQLNKYAVGDSATLSYRHAATAGGVLSAEWSVYGSPFVSLGYVQLKVANGG